MEMGTKTKTRDQEHCGRRTCSWTADSVWGASWRIRGWMTKKDGGGNRIRWGRRYPSFRAWSDTFLALNLGPMASGTLWAHFCTREIIFNSHDSIFQMLFKKNREWNGLSSSQKVRKQRNRKYNMEIFWTSCCCVRFRLLTFKAEKYNLNEQRKGMLISEEEVFPSDT